MNNPDNIQTLEVVTLQTINHPGQIDRVANQIRAHVSARNLTEDIQGKPYPKVEAWQYAGALLGLFPRVISCDDLSSRESKDVVLKKWNKNARKYEVINMSIISYKYRAEVEIVNVATGQVISKASAICTNEESKKYTFDEYAIQSMAQTRAVGKAFRILLGWIMQATGYESTPAEEMDAIADELLLAEYKITTLKALELCRTTDDMKDLMEDAASIKDDLDVRKKAIQINEKIKAESNGK